MSWTSATKRLSPQVIIKLLEITGKEYNEHLQTLNLFDKAIFSVTWAGQETSPNWFHIAREYTEIFLHQQQIRDAVGKPGNMTKELFYPLVDTFMFAFPHSFSNVLAKNGTTVSIEVSTDIGGIWNIIKTNAGWELDKSKTIDTDARIIIEPETVWKLFSKSWRPEQVRDKVKILGDSTLAKQALNIVAVMA